MFKKGSYVTYRSEGVCVISDIRRESFFAIGDSQEYYILTPIREPRSTVFVPVNNTILTSYMHELLSARQIAEIALEQRDARIEWQTDSRARTNAYKEILSRGNRCELIALINTVQEQSEKLEKIGKRLCSSDKNAMHKAEKMLFEEFSQTTDIPSAECIIPLLRGKLTISDKSSK